jgi:hypothetical protein
MLRIVLSLAFMSCFFSCRENTEISKIIIPDGLEQIGKGENSKEICLKCSKKLIIYLNLEINSMHLLGINPDFWNDLRNKHPKLGIVCIIAGRNLEKKRDRNYIIKSLKESKFPFQVIYDPENKFFEMNNLQPGKNPKSSIQTFLTSSDEFILSPEIGIPELFEEQFKEFLLE